MTSTRLLLEGSDIESLLAQVRDQYGDSARIISADKVRSGGIGGFFAKERFELSVEIDGDPAPAAPASVPAAVAAAPGASPSAWPELPTPAHERAAAAIDSVQALLDLADRQETQLGGHRPASHAQPAPPSLPPPSLPPPSLPPPSLPPSSPPPASFSPAAALPAATTYDAIRAVEAFAAASRPPEPPPVEEPIAAEAPLPSTSGAEFAEILAGLRDNIGSSPPVTPSVRPYRPSADTPDGQHDDPFPGASSVLGDSLVYPAAQPTRFEPPQLLAAEPPAATATPGHATPGHATPGHATPGQATSSESPSSPDTTYAPPPAYTPHVPQHAAHSDTLIRPAAHTPPVLAPQHAPGEDTAGEDGLRDQLVRLGLPTNLAQRAIGRDPYTGIIRALGMLPAPAAAPSAPGQVLVVAGELSGAMTVARQAVKRMRIDAASILVVGPTVAGTGLHPSRRLSGATDAQRRSPKLHAADVPHVVVVDAPLEVDNSGWVREVIEALGASAVWAVVDATRKTADVARQLRGFGLVDAIAVHGVTATGDPASVLSLGVPVASLDGRKATPQAWAALLCDLLDDPR